MDLPPHHEILRRVRHRRDVWGVPPPSGVVPEVPGPGEESVWDYPRPPAVQPVPGRVRVVHQGAVVADTLHAQRIVETAGAPVYYVRPADVRMDWLAATDHVTLCEWKGAAVHYDLVVGEQVVRRAAFAYPDPLTDLGRGYEAVAGWIAFYAGRVDEAWVGEVRAAPQPGGVYAGWVTPNVVGPIKGGPGTAHW